MGQGSEEEVFGHILLWFGDGFDDVLEAVVGFAQMHVDEGSQVEHIWIAVVDVVGFIEFFQGYEYLLQSLELVLS